MKAVEGGRCAEIAHLEVGGEALPHARLVVEAHQVHHVGARLLVLCEQAEPATWHQGRYGEEGMPRVTKGGMVRRAYFLSSVTSLMASVATAGDVSHSISTKRSSKRPVKCARGVASDVTLL